MKFRSRKFYFNLEISSAIISSWISGKLFVKYALLLSFLEVLPIVLQVVFTHQYPHRVFWHKKGLQLSQKLFLLLSFSFWNHFNSYLVQCKLLAHLSAQKKARHKSGFSLLLLMDFLNLHYATFRTGFSSRYVTKKPDISIRLFAPPLGLEPRTL